MEEWKREDDRETQRSVKKIKIIFNYGGTISAKKHWALKKYSMTKSLQTESNQTWCSINSIKTSE